VFRRLEPRRWPCGVMSRPAAAADRPEPWNTHQILRICRKTAVTVALPGRARCPGAVHQAYIVLLLGRAAAVTSCLSSTLTLSAARFPL
jgi:hypothetical protein